MPASVSKSDRAHMVPLSAAMAATIGVVPRMGPFVWTTNGTNHVQAFAKAKARLDVFLSATGDPMAPWVFHDLRRSVWRLTWCVLAFLNWSWDVCSTTQCRASPLRSTRCTAMHPRSGGRWMHGKGKLHELQQSTK